jgi:hypothetical protein
MKSDSNPPTLGSFYPRCLRCGATALLEYGTGSVIWNEARAEYAVVLRVSCRSCADTISQIVSELEFDVARESSCPNCESALKLKSYRFFKDNGDLGFEGSYRCPRCGPKPVLLKRLLQYLQRGAARVTEFHIGPDGIRVKKLPSPKDEPTWHELATRLRWDEPRIKFEPSGKTAQKTRLLEM